MYVNNLHKLTQLLRDFEIHMTGQPDSGDAVRATIQLRQAVAAERARLQGHAASLMSATSIGARCATGHA